MYIQFVVSLFATFLVTRLSAHFLHDQKNYGTKKERSYTITGMIRSKTRYDLHHYHIGIIIIVMAIGLIIAQGMSSAIAVLLAIGTSLVADQLSPLLASNANYFDTKQLIISFLFHILIAVVAYFEI